MLKVLLPKSLDIHELIQKMDSVSANTYPETYRYIT